MYLIVMNNLYKAVKGIIKDFYASPIVQNMDLPNVTESPHLIQLFEDFIKGYKNIKSEYFIGSNVGLLITTNRIIENSDINQNTKIIISNDFNSYLYTMLSYRRAQPDNDTYFNRITVLKDRNLILYKITEAIYPTDINFKYSITTYGFEELQEIIIKHGYLPAFDPNCIALIPMAQVKNAKLETIQRRYDSNIKSLSIDATGTNWIPMFVTSNDVNIINENTIEQIINAIPPETIKIDMDGTFSSIISRCREYAPELTGVLLQLAL